MAQGKKKSDYSLTVITALRVSDENVLNFLSWALIAQQRDFFIRLAVDIKESNLNSRHLSEFRNLNPERLICEKFGGPGKARNSMLNDIKTSHVAFWDADDLPQVEVVYEFLRNQPYLKDKFIVGQWEHLRLGVKTSVSSDFCLANLALEPGFWRVIFPSSAIRSKRFPECNMGEDQAFLFHSGIFASKPIWTDSHFYTYKSGNPNQLTQQPKNIQDLEKSIGWIEESLSKSQLVESRYGHFIILKMFFTYWSRNSNVNYLRKISFTLAIILRLPSKSTFMKSIVGFLRQTVRRRFAS